MKKILMMIMLCLSLGAQAGGDIAAGKTKSAVCTACHGQEGISVNPLWPNLAGQHEAYLLKQLRDIKEGKTRVAPLMVGIVAGLSDQDLVDLSAYYASLPPAQGSVEEKYVALGQRLYRGGDLSKHLTACIACHGPKGTGNAQAGFPVLSGQHAAYLIKQLQDFQSGITIR